MASDLGATPIATEFRDSGDGETRQIWVSDPSCARSLNMGTNPIHSM